MQDDPDRVRQAQSCLEFTWIGYYSMAVEHVCALKDPLVKNDPWYYWVGDKNRTNTLQRNKPISCSVRRSHIPQLCKMQLGVVVHKMYPLSCRLWCGITVVKGLCLQFPLL